MIIIIAFYIISVIYKIFLLNYLEERFKEYDTWDNYYVEIRSFEEARLTEVRQIWYRDNKYKIVIQIFEENSKNTINYQWVDCDKKIVIQYDGKSNYKRQLTDIEAKNFYNNGKYINSYMNWKETLTTNKIKYIFEINSVELNELEEKTRIIIKNKVINFEKNSIIPNLYVDKTNGIDNYKYYNIKLNSVNDEDVIFKEDL